MLTVGSLFAGIGGFDLGLERAGMRSVWQCEIDPYAQRVLEKHWPDVLRVPDVRDVGAGTVPYVDVICGGFPCQDLSWAGAGAGITGERSGLWSEYARIIRELRPRYVIVENVAALLARGLDVVLRDLAEVGMAAEWGCIRASDVGAPHRRDRLWLVAYPNGEGEHDGAVDAEVGRASQSLGDPQGDGRRPGRQGRPLAAGEGQREPERALQDVADPARHLSARSATSGAYRERARQRSDAQGFMADSDQIGWEWWPRVFGPGWWRELEDSGWWSAESGVRGVADGLSPGLDGGRVDAGAQDGPVSTVRVVRGGTDPQALLDGPAGGSEPVPGEEVLRSSLQRGRADQPGDNESADDVLALEEACEGGVRAVRLDGSAARPSQGRGHHEQRSGEPGDALRGVPQPPPLSGPVANRNARLRSLGNALVPQIAELIGRRILEWERVT